MFLYSTKFYLKNIKILKNIMLNNIVLESVKSANVFHYFRCVSKWPF